MTYSGLQAFNIIAQPLGFCLTNTGEHEESTFTFQMFPVWGYGQEIIDQFYDTVVEEMITYCARALSKTGVTVCMTLLPGKLYVQAEGHFLKRKLGERVHHFIVKSSLTKTCKND